MSVDTSPIRVLAVDDHSIFRQGLAAVLAAQPDMSLVAEASNGQEAIEPVPRASPGHHLDGLADAINERPGSDVRDSRRISRRANHHTGDLPR